jgi:Ni/Fe-hydrogenase subunit HybB-like protein
MVSFETILSGKYFKHKPPMDILSGLMRGSLIVAVLYFVLKIWQLATGPGIGAAFDGGTAGNMYLLEMLIGVILPMILLSMKDMRSRISSIFVINILVITGIVLNRFNVAIFSMAEYSSRSGVDYFPSVMEFLVTLAMVSFAIFAFKLSVKYLRVFPEGQH